MPSRKIEIFSAGCGVCEDAIALVNGIACSSCDVIVLDMQDKGVAKRAQELGIKSVPAIVVDGKLASCCEGKGPDAETLKNLGVGQPL